MADTIDFKLLERLPTKNPDSLRELLHEVEQPVDRRLGERMERVPAGQLPLLVVVCRCRLGSDWLSQLHCAAAVSCCLIAAMLPAAGTCCSYR